VLLQRPQRTDRLAAARDLLHDHGRRAHLRGRDDERVVGQLVGIEDGHRPVLADRLLDEQPPDQRIAAASRPEDRGAPSEVLQVLDAEFPAHADSRARIGSRS
jgi:hypothetical protein